jgi:hypothetical protein
MHGPVSFEEFLHHISGFLGAYYLTIALMNAIAAYYLWQSGKAKRLFDVPGLGVPFTTALIWLGVSLVFTVLGAIALGGDPSSLGFPQVLRDSFDLLMQPASYTLGTAAALGIMFLGRKFFVIPSVAWTMLNLALLFMGLAMTDPDFASIVTKADNVPIVAMIFLLGYFTWLSAYRAVQNDERAKNGQEPIEKLDSEKILVWPDLVYTELICMLVLTAILLFWGIGLQAPLEEPASSVKTPNPSKAPWYFLGLQEMLVYYDPWMAGVVLPGMVVAGLMAIPYIDFNKKGNGYYTINERKFAYLTFQFGFLVLWVTLIVMGTFLRGPNWNFFGLFETWDAHKVEALNNVDLSEFFWIKGLGRGRPKAPDTAGLGVKVLFIVYRELPGILLLLTYFGAAPPAMVLYSRFLRGLFVKMGFMRFMVLSHLILFMALLPIKMVLRWTINFKYFISIPEYFLNF